MTLTELRYLVALAREKHFGHAAEACFVSQPTLSVAIKKLEEELGVTLVERLGSRVGLTPVGERVVEQAQRVLNEAEVVRQITRSVQDPLAEPLRLGVIYTVGPYLLPHLIPALTDVAPGMPLQIEENYTHRLVDLLQNGSLDAIIVSQPFAAPGVLVRDLYQEPFRVVLPPQHPLAAEERLDPARLQQENLLLLGQGHCFRNQVLDACPKAPGSASLEGSSLETIRYMVASGLGVSILPCMALTRDNGIVAVRDFQGAAPQRRVSLAWRVSFPRPEAIEVILRAVARCTLPCVEKLNIPNPER